MLLVYIIMLIIGIAVGALTGITGSSGVLVVVPVLSYMGINFKTSVGTSLLVDVVTTTIVIYVYLRKKTLNPGIGIVLGIGAIIGAQLGSLIAGILPVLPLEIIFTAMAAYMSYYVIKKSYNIDSHGVRKMELSRNLALIIGFALSIPVGILTGVIGTSGGIMFVLIIMVFFSMKAQNMVGTATLAMFLSAASGSIGYYDIGHIDFLAAILIGVVALVSGYYFSIFAHKIKQKYIYRFIGVVFIIVVISEIVKIVVL
ncbi:sulfite exporter TauE/SafE family protein [Ferroplasma acidiphilum]|uniref:Probable membrane transporter protein n=3 Tax=Ferroplasma TaxID=74968 RepID=S0ANY2_FERAC|nr:transporter [Ferroplasma acidarmanus Fer1]NOL60325.1 sulfite exporter TauE/SafE family protein [Ferroplasma acidiphilum]